jgi:hypothetical protein
MINGRWFPPSEIDSDDEHTFLTESDEMDGLYCSAWDNGTWEVGYDGPIGGPIEQGTEVSLAAAKQAAVTALEGQLQG